MKITLQVVTSILEPFQVYFDSESYVIGRSGSVDLVIRDPAISRRHARIYKKGKNVYLEDLGSHNGTWLNGLKLKHPVQITNGDTIELAYDEEEGACATSITVVEVAGNQTNLQTLVKPMLDMLSSQDSIQPQGLEDYESLRGYAERLRNLNEIHALLSKVESTKALLEIILDKVFSLLNPDSGAIYLFNNDGELKLEATRHLASEVTETGLPRTLLDELVKKGMAVLVHDAYHDTRFSLTDSIQSQIVTSLIATPLMDKDGTIGLIAFYSNENHDHFSEQDMEFLVAIASLATLRIRNHQLVQKAKDELQKNVEARTRELNDRTEELERLDSIVRTINMGHSLGEVLPAVLEQGLKLFPHSDKAVFFLRDRASNDFLALSHIGYPEVEGIVRLPFAETVSRYTGVAEEIHEGVYHSDKAAINRIPPLPGIPMPQSMLVMSLVVDEQLEGFLILDNFSDESYNHEDIERLARFRDHATSAVAKAQLLHTLEERNKDIQKAQNQLIIREKMVSLGQLTAGVSHEINNPNNFIRGATQNLTAFLEEFKEFLFELAGEDAHKEITDSFNNWFEKIQSQVDSIYEGSHRIEDIVKDLRLVTRLDEAEFKEVDIFESLNACINLLTPNYSDQIEFETELGKEQKLYCQAAEMNQVFLNIITNSCEAITNESNTKTGRYGRIFITSKTLGDTVYFQFLDNGPGIPMEKREKVFEAFYTTKDPGQNTGIGLYHCYQIMEKHNGHIRIKDSDEGCLIELELPILDPYQR